MSILKSSENKISIGSDHRTHSDSDSGILDGKTRYMMHWILHALRHPIRCEDSQVPPSILVCFNGFEKRLEISCTEALGKKTKSLWSVFAVGYDLLPIRKIILATQKFICMKKFIFVTNNRFDIFFL